MNALHLLWVLHSILYLVGIFHTLCGRPAQQPVSHRFPTNKGRTRQVTLSAVGVGPYKERDKMADLVC